MTDATEEEKNRRRERRELRRARQREANVDRAREMHAARLTHSAAQKNFVLHGAPARRVKIGCSGWFYWHWRDCFYPVGMPTSRWFDFYADQFRTVELNAPFYSWPTLPTIQTWRRQAARRQFTYSIKVNELITHRRRFVGTKTLIRDFGLIADLLGQRFGCFLFQLPPSFHYTPAALTRVLDQLDPARRNVVEFRHRSWWNARVYRAFRESRTTFCSCSAPRLPDELIVTGEVAYLRFHGVKRWYRHDYSGPELASWAERIKRSKAEQIWVYFNNDRDAFAIKNARELLRQLRGKT